MTRWRRWFGKGRSHDDERTPVGPAVDPKTGEILPASSEAHDAEETGIAGERTLPSVNRERSVRSRVSSALAIATLVGLSGGLLVWYYATQIGAARKAEGEARRVEGSRTAGEMKLPPLGRVDPPDNGPVASVAATSAEVVLGPAPPAPPALSTTPTPVVRSGPPPKSLAQLALERKLGQPVLLQGAGASPRSVAASAAPSSAAPSLAGARPDPTGDGQSLAQLLRPTPTPAVSAQVLPTRRFLLPKGAFVDCTLETAIDSTFDGMVTCIGASDVFSADGKVVLLERGTKYVGEKRGEVRQGQGRVFVLWNEARTPTGVVVALASPGTDELGRSGLPGFVDTHFWDRFGAAILISVIDGALQALAASQQRDGGGGAVVISPQGSRDVLTEVLKNTIAIPPTVVKNQGDRVQVLVARDVDFRSVYALRDIGER